MAAIHFTFSYTSNDTHPSGIGDGSGELWTSCNVHPSQDDWVFDLQEIGEGGLDLLRGRHGGGLCMRYVDVIETAEMQRDSREY
jgi:hypothetical protein